MFNYSFSEDEASPTNSFLNDLVYIKDFETIVITDSGLPLNETDELQPALLVVDTAQSEVKRLLSSFPSMLNVRSKTSVC